MGRPALYPLTFEPVLKDYIWGGRKLATLLGRTLPPAVNIAESWEIAAHPHGDTKVANGPLRGRSLAALTSEYGSELTGTFASPGRFPLLVKLLDAQEKLSVQVHPDDVYARTHEDGELGKSEMWVVLHAEPEAALVLGLQPGATREAFGEALAAGRLEEWLHVLPVQAGDAVCVPAGTLHAILGGTVIAEIQQNSDATYRVYDWNRAGADGKPRPLHVDKAMEVIDFSQVQPGLAQPVLVEERDGIRRWQLCCGPTFVVERVALAAGPVWQGRCNGESLEIWGTIAGKARLEAAGVALGLPAVGFALLPATVGPFTVAAAEPAEMLRTTLRAAVEN
jgi:mannose-6-phosphate isomerase